MDDSQDKVRRNLVVFSAAIVIGWFLNLKLTNITNLLVSTDIGNVNASKFWVTVLVVLIYLFFRYWFDDTTRSQIVALRDELMTQRKNYLFKLLLGKVKQINQTQQFSPIFSTSLAESVTREKEQYEKEYSQKISFRLRISNPWVKKPVASDNTNAIWENAVSISEEYLKEGASHTLATHSGKIHDFSIPLSGRVWISVHAIIHVVSYSKSAVDFVVPMVLAGFAMTITACKLIATNSI